MEQEPVDISDPEWMRGNADRTWGPEHADSPFEAAMIWDVRHTPFLRPSKRKKWPKWHDKMWESQADINTKIRGQSTE